MLLPAGERRLYQHADARAHGQEGRRGRGPLSCRLDQAPGGTPGLTPRTPGVTRRTPGVNGMTQSASSEPSSAPRMTALVTGGTGFLGASLTRRLLSDGAGVRVLARSRANAQPLADLGAEVVTGDITDRASVRDAVDGVRVVYHLAGPLLVPGVPASEYR